MCATRYGSHLAQESVFADEFLSFEFATLFPKQGPAVKGIYVTTSQHLSPASIVAKIAP